ncbi:unnamed protein product [Rotaria socialis]|uniref:DUF4386 domain-containing protein n=1 Tax=Rotaria socialis TaxID=392032 RepID=A0A818QVI5_9BILA|nr:unnamed protein product [Rotaria socialis]CAF4627749.1 unnamed protein product [Rotaria socialis]
MSVISQRTAALVAGFSILIMAILAGFAYGFVLNGLIVPDNTTLTANNIKSSIMLFRVGIFSFLLVLIFDVLAAWSLHVFLKLLNENLSLLTAWFRLVYSAILGIALLNLAFVVLLLNGSNYLSVFETNQLNALVTFFLKGFNNIWSMGLVVFGCHLFVLGYLVFKSGYIPKLFGILLIIASLCYITSNFANLLLSNYEKYKATVELFISLPMIIGELGFGLWLLFKGGIEPQSENDLNEKTD